MRNERNGKIQGLAAAFCAINYLCVLRNVTLLLAYTVFFLARVCPLPLAKSITTTAYFGIIDCRLPTADQDTRQQHTLFFQISR
jgi:hypothetical protein